MPLSRLSARRRAAALALSALAALAAAGPGPAAAGPAERDLARFLAGAAVGIIVMNALQPPPVYAAPAPVVVLPPPPPPPVHGAAWLILPAHCGHDYTLPGSADVIYLDGCLRQAGYVHPLPRHCAVSVHTPHGLRTGWSGSCLCEAGYRVRPGWSY